MNNSRPKEKNLITPERASVLFPTIISSFISFIIISAFVIPKYISSNKVYFEYQEFIRKKNELASLKLQAIEISKKLEVLNYEKAKIISLISGRLSLDTFLASLGAIANNNNIELISLVPKSIIKYVKTEKNTIDSKIDLDKELNIEKDPLLVEGLEKNIINISFKSSYQNFLDFLREIEFQENVILIRDIKLSPFENNDTNEKKIIKKNVLEGSFKMIVYGNT